MLYIVTSCIQKSTPTLFLLIFQNFYNYLKKTSRAFTNLTIVLCLLASPTWLEFKIHAEHDRNHEKSSEKFVLSADDRHRNEKNIHKADESDKALKETRKVVINFRLRFPHLHPYVLYITWKEVTASETRVALLLCCHPSPIDDVSAHCSTP